MLMPGKANVLIDGQFGSTGKGLLAGYIAYNTKIKANYAVTNAAPNAGHTFFLKDGTKIIAKHLPMYGIVDKNCIIYLDAGAVIKPDVLFKEMAEYGVEKERVVIHPRAGIITDADIAMEKKIQSPTTQLASTQSGVGSAISRKVNRYKDGIAGNCDDLSSMIGKVELDTIMKQGGTVIIETPQGVGLGLNDGYQYPYCTSRNVSVSQSLADATIHPYYMGYTFLSMRTYPIRVGNLKDENGKQIGYSGDFYPDSVESTFAELKQEDEYTTVTGRVRRVASFSYQQYKDACALCRPEYVFLNFVNYLPDHNAVLEMLTKCERIHKPKCKWLLGHGPKLEDVAVARPITGREY